jgi:prophage maintenance system killer protein
MNCLTLEQLLEIHALVVKSTGGSTGLRDLGRLESAMLSGLTLLEINSKHFKAKPGEIEDFAVVIAIKNIDVPQISNWLQTHAK